MKIAAIIGFLIASFMSGYISDVITARRIIKNRGLAIPEGRLISLIPGCIFARIGCIIVAFACQHKAHWAVIAVGFGLGKFLQNVKCYCSSEITLCTASFGTVFAPNIAMTYLIDSYPAFASEILVVVNVSKNLVAFLFVFVAVDWIDSQGWIEVYTVMFVILTASLLAAIPLYFFGAAMRRFLARRLWREI